MPKDAGAQAGKRNGNVQQEVFLREDYLSRLERLVVALNEDALGIKFERRSLAQLIAGLQQFQEDALGVNALYKHFPKLPASLLRDVAPDGPLRVVGALCAEFMKARGLKRIDWTQPNFRADLVNLVARMRQELQRRGLLPQLRIHVQPACGADALKLAHCAKRLGAELASDEDTASVTHVVYPFGPGGDPDRGEHYLRVLQTRGQEAAFVHWWYLPDSYDEWVGSGVVGQLEAEQPKRVQGPWRVYARWLLDSEKYNEWMNPADYETEESLAAQEARAKRLREGGAEPAGEAGEGQAADGQAAKRARAAAAGGALPELVPGSEEEVAPGVTRATVQAPDRGTLDAAARAVNLSQPQPQAGAAQAARGRPPAPPGGGPPPHRIPLSASWFKFEAVGELERRAFADLCSFITAAAPRGWASYTAARNAIIRLYKEDPSRELALSDVLHQVEGNAELLARLHAFLCREGLVNLDAYMAQQAGAGAGVPVLTTFGAVPTAAEGAAAAMGARARAGKLLVMRRAAPAAASGVRYYCSALPGVDCTGLRFHCTKVPDYDLCPRAYAEGLFPPGCCAADFVRVTACEAAAPRDPAGWTDQETLLLLEGLELYGEDWAQVAEHVGTRNQMACIMAFLRLPIEDEAAGELLGPSAALRAYAGGRAPPTVAFADTGNPIVALVAFLASAVGPKVAAAAAQHALEVLAAEEGGADPATPAAADSAPAGDDVRLRRGGLACGVAAPPARRPAAAARGPSLPALPGGDPTPPQEPFSEARLRAAAEAALQAAASKARQLAEGEEREMQRLAIEAVQLQARKVQVKLQQLDALHDLVGAEHAKLEARRAAFLAQRAQQAAAGAPPQQPAAAQPPAKP